jgi:cob(I)alamin adenosyltransferase
VGRPLEITTVAYHATSRQARMGNRLSKIYTRTGDDGTTGLADGKRVDKCDVRIEAGGTVDEVNSLIGAILAEPGIDVDVAGTLRRIQHELFEAGAELALPSYTKISPAYIERLEQELDTLNSALPPLKEFILPGGNRPAALCHIARAVCRRAERRAWAVAKEHALNPELLRYLNRLSDLLFVVARCLARRGGGGEIMWRREL